MILGKLDTLIIEDLPEIRGDLVGKLGDILNTERILEAGNFKEAQSRINELKAQEIKKLVLILDGQFPYSEAEPKPHYMWRELLKWIMNQFGPEFLLYLIPFSGDIDTHHYMHDENQDNPRIRVITGEELKNSDRVIKGLKSISNS